MQTIRFGRIRNLSICNRDPDFNTRLEIVDTVKMNGRNGNHPFVDTDDYVLKQEVGGLMNLLDDLCEGGIENIEVKDGIPFCMDIRRRVTIHAPHGRTDHSVRNSENLTENSVNSRAFPVGKQ